MAWTATVSKESLVDGSKIFVVTYTDGSRTVTDRFDVQGGLTDTELSYKVQARIDSLTQQDAAFTAVTIGIVVPLPRPILSPPTPTPAEAAQVQFLSDYRQWLNIKKAIDVGILTGKEPRVVALLARVRSEFKQAYLPLL